MYSASSAHLTWLCTSVMLVLTIIVCVADRLGSLTSVRMTLHEVLSPGRLVLASLTSPFASSTPPAVPTSNLTDGEAAELQNALLQNELQRRQLLIENARLHNEVR